MGIEKWRSGKYKRSYVQSRNLFICMSLANRVSKNSFGSFSREHYGISPLRVGWLVLFEKNQNCSYSLCSQASKAVIAGSGDI